MSDETKKAESELLAKLAALPDPPARPDLSFPVGQRVRYRVALVSAVTGEVEVFSYPAVVVAIGDDECHRYVCGPGLPGKVMMHTARLRRRGWEGLN